MCQSVDNPVAGVWELSPEQLSYAFASNRHWKYAAEGEENWKVGFGPVTAPSAGPASMLGVVSTVKSRCSGVGSSLPTPSTAATLKLWSPSLRSSAA
jgi:hypothetical protein